MVKKIQFKDVGRGKRFRSDLDSTEMHEYIKLEAEYELVAIPIFANATCLDTGCLANFPDDTLVEINT